MYILYHVNTTPIDGTTKFYKQNIWLFFFPSLRRRKNFLTNLGYRGLYMVKHVSVKDTCMDTTIQGIGDYIWLNMLVLKTPALLQLFRVQGTTVYMVKHVSVKDTCMVTTIQGIGDYSIYGEHVSVKDTCMDSTIFRVQGTTCSIYGETCQC